MKEVGVGTHYIVDLMGCNKEKLKFVSPVEELFLKAARDCKATIITHAFHQFEPIGVSGVILIAESHMSIHTWPQQGYAAVGIFTCGEVMKPEVAVEVLREGFEADSVLVNNIQRGIA